MMKKNKRNSIIKKIGTILKAHFKELQKLDRQAGASLIEVMVAVAIIVILMSAIGIAVVGNIDKANIAMTSQHIDTMKMAIKMYQLDNNGKLPESLDEIISFLDPPQKPLDAWKHEYIWEPGEDGVTYKLFSTGKDGEKGTADDIPKPADEEAEAANP